MFDLGSGEMTHLLITYGYLIAIVSAVVATLVMVTIALGLRHGERRLRQQAAADTCRRHTAAA